MVRVILVGLMLASGAALAATDFKCMQDCLEKGYLYGLCESRCSYGDAPVTPTPAVPVQAPSRMDPKCMQDCRAAGYLYVQCKSECTNLGG